MQEVHNLSAEHMKLIAYGKVMDKGTLSSFNIKEDDFIVVMIPKNKPPPKKVEDAKQEEPAQQPA